MLFRSPFGFKPLCIGKRDHAYIITSETCALETIDAEFVRDVLPGEVVTISKDGTIHSDTSLCISQEKEARCIFEYIYLQDRTAILMGYLFMLPESGQDSFWLWILM